jgi:hypothetical protein
LYDTWFCQLQFKKISIYNNQLLFWVCVYTTMGISMVYDELLLEEKILPQLAVPASKKACDRLTRAATACNPASVSLHELA